MSLFQLFDFIIVLWRCLLLLLSIDCCRLCFVVALSVSSLLFVVCCFLLFVVCRLGLLWVVSDCGLLLFRLLFVVVVVASCCSWLLLVGFVVDCIVGRCWLFLFFLVVVDVWCCLLLLLGDVVVRCLLASCLLFGVFVDCWLLLLFGIVGVCGWC